MPAVCFESPLALAARGNHMELAFFLLDQGANVDEVNINGYTPLMEAARKGHDEMVVLLISHGADINAQKKETQETALTLACCGGFTEVAHFLVMSGANLELGAKTPLMEAAQKGHVETVRYLIGCGKFRREGEGSNLDATTATGDTALKYAYENNHNDVADIILLAKRLENS